jgi:anti-sigma factor RsiW
MTCRELSDFIADYLSGELPEEHRRIFEQHVARCSDCSHYLDSYRRTVALGRSAFADDEATPPEVPAGLIKAILSARRQA